MKPPKESPARNECRTSRTRQGSIPYALIRTPSSNFTLESLLPQTKPGRKNVVTRYYDLAFARLQNVH